MLGKTLLQKFISLYFFKVELELFAFFNHLTWFSIATLTNENKYKGLK